MTNKYDDIINLPHHVSKTRPQMSMLDRAAQFSPFAALTGFDDAVDEAGRLTDSKIELEDEALTLLDEKLQFLEANLAHAPVVTFTYFKPDDRKSGGAYIQVTGIVRKIDHIEKLITFYDCTQIPIEDILNIEGDLFSSFL